MLLPSYHICFFSALCSWLWNLLFEIWFPLNLSLHMSLIYALCINKVCINEWISEWVNELMSEWINERLVWQRHYSFLFMEMKIVWTCFGRIETNRLWENLISEQEKNCTWSRIVKKIDFSWLKRLLGSKDGVWKRKSSTPLGPLPGYSLNFNRFLGEIWPEKRPEK